jgi:intracellular septation protein A
MTQGMPKSARVFVTLVMLTGGATLAFGASRWDSAHPTRFLTYLAVALLVSGLKVPLPGIRGTMSVNFLFILIGILDLSFSETLAIGCAAAAMQCVWKTKSRPTFVKVGFNVAAMAIAVACSFLLYHSAFLRTADVSPILVLGLAACALFVTNTVPVAIVIALLESRSPRDLWREGYFWSFPYYLVGAAVAGLLSATTHYVGWQTALLILPVIHFTIRSYRVYLGRLDAEKSHAREMAATIGTIPWEVVCRIGSRIERVYEQ